MHVHVANISTIDCIISLSNVVLHVPLILEMYLETGVQGDPQSTTDTDLSPTGQVTGNIVIAIVCVLFVGQGACRLFNEK